MAWRGIGPDRCRGCGKPRLAAMMLGLLAPVSAQAQGIDYSQLQEMFGEPVTTSVTGKPQRASEAAATLIIITREDIRRSAARDIPGLLQTYSGIDVTRWTSGQADIAIRGGVRPMNPNLLVLVNGRQVYLDHYGMTNWGSIGVQLGEIQQIEIVKGPNSALFGFNAVSGVINIITINPVDRPFLSLSASLGTEGQTDISAVAALPLGEGIGLRLSGGYGKSDELDGLEHSALASRLVPVTRGPEHKEGSAEIYAALSDRTHASVSVTRTRNRLLENTPVLFTVPGHYDFTSLGGRISHDTGWGMISARAFRNWSDIDAMTDSGDLHFDNDVFVASTEMLVRAGTKNDVRAGLEFRANRLEMTPGYPGATRYKVYAASGMWESRLSPAVTWTLAGRVDHLKLSQQGTVDQPSLFSKEDFKRDSTEWSVNSALRLTLGDADTLRASINRGVQAPSLFSLGARLTFPIPGLPIPFVISGDPNLKPAKVWSAEFGWSHMFPANGSRFSLTAFYNHSSDLMSNSALASPPRAMPPQYPFILQSSANVGSYEAYGLEAEVSGRFGSNWVWMANYTWTHSRQDIPGNSADMFLWPLALDRASPEHKAKAQISYERGSWLATLAARYTSSTRQLVVAEPPGGAMWLVRVDDGLALDAKIAVQLHEHLALRFVGENLTDIASAYLSPAPAERRLRAELEVSF